VLDASGAVLGMLLPREIKGRQLPEGVSFGINATALRNAITAAGIASADQSAGAAPLSNEALVRHASGMTVLVSCWE
jgi:hypothetical protein